MLLIQSLAFEAYDTLSRSSILVIAGGAVVLYLSNFETSAEHESQANGEGEHGIIRV